MCPSYKWDEVRRHCETWQYWKGLPVKYPSFPSFTALIWMLKTVQLFAISVIFSLSFSHAVGGQAVPPAGTSMAMDASRAPKSFVPYPIPPHPNQQGGTKQRGCCRHSLSKQGHQKIWTEQSPETTWLSLLYPVASFCFLRIKHPLRFRRA